MRQVRLLIYIFIFSAGIAAAAAYPGRIRGVVSLAPSITEMLFEIGLNRDEIIAVSDYCDYPPQAREIPRVGSLSSVNIEKVVSLEPDYVFTSGHEQSPLNLRLRQAGLNTVVIEPLNITEITDAIINLVMIVGKEKSAARPAGR